MMTNTNFPVVKMGTFLTHRKEFITIDDFQEYKRARVRLHGKGIVLRDIVEGGRLRTKKQQVARAGEFLVAEIDAKVGGFGIVPPDLDGAIVSSHYFLFEIDDTVCLPAWLDWYAHGDFLRAQVPARGSTNYAAIRPRHVLEFEIPLPPLEEQRRIVARIEALAEKVNAARRLRQEAVEEADCLLVSQLSALRHGLLRRYPTRKIGEITKITSGGTPSRKNLDYWNGDIPWVKSGELRDGDISSVEEYISLEGLKNSGAKIFPPDTIVVALYGQTRGRTGRLTIHAATNQACAAILPKPDVLLSLFVQYWFRGLYHEMRERSRGGAQPNWSGKMIKNVEIALPPLPEQRRIVAYLDKLQARVDALRALQAETQAELDALLPSILDKAFRGELH